MSESIIPSTNPIPGEARHLPELDGIRGIAILCVLLSHAVDFLGVVPKSSAWGLLATRALLPLWGGVDLFFTLSGFLITGILLRSRQQDGYFRTFYARRALRIFPIYYIFLSYLFFLMHISEPLASVLPHGLKAWLPYYLYVPNLPVFWSTWAGMTGLLGAYWSLAVEEQFYLVWPSVVRLVRPRWLLALCVLGFALGWGERLYMIRHHGLRIGVLQWPFSRLDGLFLGAALALYRQVRGKLFPLGWAAIVFGTGALLYGYIVVLHPDELQGSGPHLWTTGISAFALMSVGLVAASQHRVKWLQPGLTWRPLVAAGTYSYGMYIYHLLVYSFAISLVSPLVAPRIAGDVNPIAAFGIILLVILVTALLAALSFRLIERPILSLKRYFRYPAMQG